MRAKYRLVLWLMEPRIHVGAALLLLYLFGPAMVDWLRWLPLGILNTVAAILTRFGIYV